MTDSKVAILSCFGEGQALAEVLGGLCVTGTNQSNDDLKRWVDETLARSGRVWQRYCKVYEVADGITRSV